VKRQLGPVVWTFIHKVQPTPSIHTAGGGKAHADAEPVDYADQLDATTWLGTSLDRREHGSRSEECRP
jgi:hypothetical protein